MGTEQNPANQKDPKTVVGDEVQPFGEDTEKKRQQDQDEAGKTHPIDDEKPEKTNRLPG